MGGQSKQKQAKAPLQTTPKTTNQSSNTQQSNQKPAKQSINQQSNKQSKKRSLQSINQPVVRAAAFPTATLDRDETEQNDDSVADEAGVEEGDFAGFPDLVDEPPSDDDDLSVNGSVSRSVNGTTEDDSDDSQMDEDSEADAESEDDDSEDEEEEESEDEDFKPEVPQTSSHVNKQTNNKQSAKQAKAAAAKPAKQAPKQSTKPITKPAASPSATVVPAKQPVKSSENTTTKEVVTAPVESEDETEEEEPRHWTESARDDGDVETARAFIEADENPEYLSDSSDDEGVTGQELRYKNRIGNIPVEWYKDLDHIGYNVKGQAITRQGGGETAIDRFLSMMDRDSSRRTVYDAVNDEYIALTDDELRSLNRLRHGGYAHLGFDPYIDYTGQAFTEDIRHERLGNAQEPKARFIPSKHEAKRVVKLIRALRLGWIRSDEQIEQERKAEREAKSKSYLMWGDDGQVLGSGKTGLHRMPVHIPAPHQKLPGHAHSYNPPSEYLMSKAEEQQWLEADPSDRALDFIPRKYSTMREIPAYNMLIKERFERCLDLYLAPRVRRKKINIGDPESLIPSLPKPSELKPFPTMLSLSYVGHTGRIRSLSVSPNGEWLLSGGEDGTVRMWEVATGRCFKVWDFRPQSKDDAESVAAPVIEHVAFNPDPRHPVFTVCVGRYVMVLRHGYGRREDEAAMDLSMRTKTAAQIDIEQKLASEGKATMSLEDGDDDTTGARKREILWVVRREKHGKIEGVTIRAPKNYHLDDDEEARDASARVEAGEEVEDAVHADDGSSVALVLALPAPVTACSWHASGDYFSSTITANQSISHVHLHRFSSHSSHSPFSKSKGSVTATAFHPHQPIFFLSTKTHILVYHLLQQKLMKRMHGSIAHISALSVHPSGDHVLVSGYDRKVAWYDLDMGSAPYRTLKYHSRAVRGVHIHKRWPLFASISDDGTAQVFHATVYDDLLTNPLIVPLKILRAHEIVDGIGGMACQWHTTQPWLITAGADGKIKLWV